MGLNEMRGGMVMLLTVYFKMRIERLRTNYKIEARRPDLLMIDKRESKRQIIDVAMSEDGRVRVKEDEKVEK